MQKQLSLLNRARMSILNAMRRFGDTDAEPHLYAALLWVNSACDRIREGKGGEAAAMINATTNLQAAAQVLGFRPASLPQGG